MEGFGTLAQLVEQRTFNPLVGGSSPPRPTKNKKQNCPASLGFFTSVGNVTRSSLRFSA